MPKQVEVRVRDISKDDNGHKTELYGTTRELTYKSFLYLNANPDNPRYELIGEIDEKGNLVPGNPNLDAQHRAQLQQSAAPVVNAGPSDREKQLLAEIELLKKQNQAQQAPVIQPQVSEPVKQEPLTQERKKPGPKPKKLAEEGATV